MSIDQHLRADARANKHRILEMARKALTADPAASLNSIAKVAGVGAGTLYRHFPNRESLVVAVYRREIEVLVESAPALLSKHRPLKAFRLWCDQFTKFTAMKYGVADIVHAATADQSKKETFVPLLGAVRQLMKACEESGEIARDNSPEDFLVFIGLLWRIPPDAAGTARIKRLLALAFRGLGIGRSTA